MSSKAPRTMPERARAQKAVARTPNVARTAATRAKLLKATIDCLYELGYHQTSTVVVTERAKVSRGAMLHHFPTKADLMMAASEHIVELRREMWALVLCFSGVSFVGNLARQVVGADHGYVIAGLLGGLVSSTNVTVTFARASRRDLASDRALATALFHEGRALLSQGRLGEACPKLEP